MDWITGSLLFVIVIGIGGWVARYHRSVFRGDYERDSRSVWWIPGGGTHGTGQVPPLIPPSDPDDRIR